MVEQLLKLWNKESYSEVTKDNFILSSYCVGNKEFVLHYITGNEITKALLIDHVWSCTNEHSIIERTDIYIYHNNIGFNDVVIEDEDYLFFTPYKKVKKSFVPLSKIEQGVDLIDISTFYSKWEKRNKNNPVISVITTVYNNAKILELAIQSVINQNAANFEYVIKDAASKDGINEVIRKYQNDINIYHSCPDKGIYDGMHQGFCLSTGEYFMILNSDDLFASNDILKSYMEAIKLHHSDSYGASIKVFYPHHRPSKIIKPNIKDLYKKTAIPHTSFLLKRDVYIEIGGFLTWMKITADCALEVMSIKKRGCSYESIDKIVVLFKGTGTSANMTFRRMREQLYCRYLYNKFNLKGYILTLRYIYKCFNFNKL